MEIPEEEKRRTVNRFTRGQKVMHISGPDGWGLDVTGKPFTATVHEVDDHMFPEDPVVFFVGGGFWRSSRLQLAPDELIGDGE